MLFPTSKNAQAKYSGVGVVISPQLLPFVRVITTKDDRIIIVELAAAGAPVYIYSVYAPNQKPEHEALRAAFWNKLTKLVQKRSQAAFYYVLGDLNTRLHGRTEEEVDVLGPHIWGKGPLCIEEDRTTNRHHAMKLCHQEQLVFANTYKARKPSQQVTYREVGQPHAAPQHHTYKGFQTLDHILCPRRSLPTVLNHKALPQYYFASDHYLVHTQLRIKLGARSEPEPPAERMQFVFDSKDHKMRVARQYNESLRSHLGQETIVTTNAPQEDPSATPRIYRYVYHTDGPCKQNQRNTQFTPASWAFVVGPGEDEGEGYVIQESHGGLVKTQRDRPYYLGTRIGSHNAGDITAMGEATLHALLTTPPCNAIRVRFDSKWAANMARGIWQPRTHHELVRMVQNIILLLEQKYSVEWVRGHQQDPGNEKADATAIAALEGNITTTGRYDPLLLTRDRSHAYIYCVSWIPAAAAEVFETRKQKMQPMTASLDHTHNKFINAMHTVAKQLFKAPCFKKRKPQITEKTLSLIDEGHRLRSAHTPCDEPQHNKRIKKQARVDKKDWMDSHPREISEAVDRHC